MRTDEIRDRFHEFFVERGHLLIPSGSLVPAAHDPSVLLTTAGMQPLKPYFLGQEKPPRNRLTSAQKCFRTVDIDVVGTTARHLTFFEMLGNFSVGDYFKQGAVEFAWDLSLNGFGLDPDRIWITVFEGDEGLGIEADEEAIEAWISVGVPRERIVACPRSENFWQAGPTGPCGPCSELYLDRGVEFGRPEDLPGGENERFLEYWNLVFMQYDQHPVDTLTPLPAKNIDTGLGLERMAAIMQDTRSVFETDRLKPLIELSESLSGRRYGVDEVTDRAMRVLADHSRGMNFLIADGVVPSNEERGYVLRRVMRRAIHQGRTLGLEPGFLARYADVVREQMGGHYPELIEQRASIDKWLASEEESFGRTLDQGMRTLGELIERGREAGEVPAADAFRLHDTFGFPFELTQELLAEEGLAVDADEFGRFMADQRRRSRAGARDSGSDPRAAALAFAGETDFRTNFVGYETLEQSTTVGAVDAPSGNGRAGVLIKLADSPFYAAGGGQVSDGGVIECADGDCRARVAEVIRLGEDQAVVAVLEEGELHAGERVVARVDRAARHATECNHTSTHLLQAALQRRLGSHVHQMGSYVGPDKLRFDFSHSQGLSAEELRDVEDQVNVWISENHRVRPITTTLKEAKALGAMALFGEKYGDIVRMVEVGDGNFSRELCGGTHVRSTGEIGVLRIVSETSSAANVRRIEALSGPPGVALLRRHDELLHEIAGELRTRPEGALEALRSREVERRTLAAAARSGVGNAEQVDIDELASRVEQVDGTAVLASVVAAADEKALLGILDRIKPKLGDAAIVLGAQSGGRALFVASVSPSVVGRGVKAGAIVRAAAQVAGGGGGGRDTMARAGGRDGAKVGAAIDAARAAIRAAVADAA
ncbi:MAG TPA: alanine--tRNA ligase [Solirubrobacteraceae bacterium]|nr:alanine--tRNA ligase [Solirubrobacteraceae bacterium]